MKVRSQESYDDVYWHELDSGPYAASAPLPSASIQPLMRVYTLGVFQILLCDNQGGSIDLTQTPAWGHGRAQDLLVLLLTRARPIARAEAGMMLWPEAGSDRRKRLLRNALWNLRRTLALNATMTHADESATTALELRETLYSLSLQVTMSRSLRDPDSAIVGTPAGMCASETITGPIWCDALAFEAAAAHARNIARAEERIALSQATLRLYTGPFLGHRRSPQASHGLTMKTDWIHDYRARVQTQWLRLVVELASDLRRLGDRDQAADFLLLAVEQDPLQIETVRKAMLLLSELGRPHEALRLYERTRSAHRDTYGSDPSVLKRLAAELRAGRMLGLEARGSAGHTSGVYPRLERSSVDTDPDEESGYTEAMRMRSRSRNHSL